MDDQRPDREGGGIRFRKLRIAFSITFGIACVLLIALWVRSYRLNDRLHFVLLGKDVVIASRMGEVLLFPIDWPVQVFGWQKVTYPIDDELAFSGGGRPNAFGFGWIKDVVLPTERSTVPPPPGSKFKYYGTGTTTLPGSGPMLPYWFAASLSGISAVLPWAFQVPSSRRFSLRTLLIATTLVAMALGILVYVSK